uniref:Predicted transposase YdaD n=1 Tax=Candidatus Kentrum sp. TC TaxID=2126339 RepID=A0A450Z7V0_9GAMM|nr:MAG: Predicted transposase YdaD [Candidatus Kentron sp. TC]
MAHKDIIGKEIIRRLALDLATCLLELPIDPDFLEVLPTEHLRIEERRADLVVELRERNGKPFLLHVEIQNNNDPAMPLRMIRYMTDILLARPGLPLRQYLIYMGSAPLAMPNGIHGSDVRYRYGVVDMREIDCQRLLKQDTPEALVLAILCDFADRDPQMVVNHIYGRLQALLGDDPKRFREYVHMLHVLSVNRNLRKHIEEANKMLTQVDLERMPFYESIMEQGMERGMEKGMEKGMEMGLEKGVEVGREKGEAALLMRLLGYKFGALPPILARRVENACSEELALWERRILNAKTLDEVFAGSLVPTRRRGNA